MATYEHPFVNLRINGIFGTTGTPVESWSTGLKIMTPSGNIPTSGITAFLETISAPIQAFHVSSTIAAGTECKLTELTAAVVGVDGHYIGGGAASTIKRPYGSPPSGSGSTVHPWTTACVLSLRTTLKRGRASNGRMYWPATALALQPNVGVIDPAQTQGIATSAATMLNAINQAADSMLGDAMGIWVMSDGAGAVNNPGVGMSAPVNAVRVGGKMDHIESREREIVEQYKSAAVTPVLSVLDQLEEGNFGDVQVFHF